MTDYKILGQEAPSADTESDLYTVPGDKSTVVRAINVTNTASASDTFDIANVEPNFVESPTFVAAGFGGSMFSTDGITWTRTTILNNTGWINIAYGNNIFVAARSTSQAAYSTNGITWTASTVPISQSIAAIKFGNNIFVAINNTTGVASSTNGITWTTSTLPVSSSWRAITYGNGLFVAVSSTYNSTVAAYSTDAITWTQTTTPGGMRSEDIAHGSGVFVVVESEGSPIYSTDAITWTQTTMNTPFMYWRAITYGNGTFVAVAQFYREAAISTNGINWTPTTLPSDPAWSEIVYGNDLFVALGGQSTEAAYSTDGITWTTTTIADNGNYRTAGAVYGTPLSLQYPSTSNSDYIFKSHEILGNETITIKGGYTLDSNNKLKIKSTNGTSTFHAFGGEI
jgi:hypothetical protein